MCDVVPEEGGDSVVQKVCLMQCKRMVGILL